MEKKPLLSARSSSNIRQKVEISNINDFLKRIDEKLKNSNTSTPTKPKLTISKKPPSKKPPRPSKSPSKPSGFECTSLDLDALKQLQTFSSGSEEKLLNLKQKLRSSKQLIKKYQCELSKAYERIAELESIVNKRDLPNSHESTKQIFNKK
jgi:hypothetical protein